jgi:Porin subfamily
MAALEGGMRKLSLLLSTLALLIAPAFAEQTRPLKFDQPNSGRSLPVKEPKYDGSCAAYGAGFVKVAGTDTCVKVGGAVSIGAGTSVRGR